MDIEKPEKKEEGKQQNSTNEDTNLLMWVNQVLDVYLFEIN